MFWSQRSRLGLGEAAFYFCNHAAEAVCPSSTIILKFWTMKLPPHNHRALKLFEFTSFFSSTKVSSQCFYLLQVFHSSKQQIGLSDMHGVPCTNLGRVLFWRQFFCCAQWPGAFQVSEPLSEADKPCASILSEIRAFEPSETLRRRCSGLARQKDKKLLWRMVVGSIWWLHAWVVRSPDLPLP